MTYADGIGARGRRILLEGAIACSSLSSGENLVPMFRTDVDCVVDAIFLVGGFVQKTLPYFSSVVLALGSRSGSFGVGNDDLGLSFSCTTASFLFVLRVGFSRFSLINRAFVRFLGPVLP